MRRLYSPALAAQLLTIALFLLLWEGVSRSGLLFVGLIPRVVDILQAGLSQVATGGIFPHLGVTLYEAGVGFGIAAFFGVATGFLLGTNSYLRAVFEPPILYFAATPKIILYPLFLMLLGAKLESKMAMAAVSGFFPIVINTTVGVMGVNPVFVKVAKSVGATPWQLFVRVYLPSSLLPVFAGFRLGLGVSLVGAILGELKVSNAGLGFLIIHAFNRFQIPQMYASILLTFLVAALVNGAMTVLLARLRRFAPASA